MEYGVPVRKLAYHKKFKYGVMWFIFGSLCLLLWLQVVWFGNTIACRSYHVTGENLDIVLLILAVLIQIVLCVLLLLFAGIATAKFNKVFHMCSGYEDSWTRRGSAALFAFSIGMIITSVVLSALPFCFHGFYNFFLMRC